MFVVSLVCGAEIALLCRQCVYLSRGLAFQNSGCGIENHLITTFRRAMQVNSDDISVAWGQIPDSRDTINGRWRLACYQDMQESVDTSKLYFLYDPVADDNCITSGGRKGMTCLSVFDTAVRCFVGEIPLRVRGRVKFLFGLKSPAPSGGTAFALITETEDYGEKQLHFWRLNLTADGMRAEADPVPLLTDPITVEDDVIVALREDAPELICMSSPGLTIRRVSVETMYPQAPTDIFTVPGAELSHFYDGFLSRGYEDITLCLVSMFQERLFPLIES
ncbi:hypothetical protein L596_004195 [Steinernema carpocapsae]|uniref:Uncharacterized protein n=1 Tax=Steinernema carpocapsae TaxID=34508 RepID=A0A4U8UZ53_STECR|nr:hypothetical protein L596_004195 [Steinernema carpocapsae]